MKLYYHITDLLILSISTICNARHTTQQLQKVKIKPPFRTDLPFLHLINCRIKNHWKKPISKCIIILCQHKQFWLNIMPDTFFAYMSRMTKIAIKIWAIIWYLLPYKNAYIILFKMIFIYYFDILYFLIFFFKFNARHIFEEVMKIAQSKSRPCAYPNACPKHPHF